MPTQLRGQSEFNSVLKRYLLFTSRDLATTLNTKGYYIARRATVETEKADRGKITSFIRQDTGRIAGMMINKRRRERGEKGLYGEDMKEAVAMVRSARLRSVSFLKSGWIPAIKRLQPLAARIGGSVPRQDRGAKQIGAAKGAGMPANPGMRAVCRILNEASGKHTTMEGLAHAVTVGEIGLAKAFDFETQSMKDYLFRKMGISASLLGIRTH